MVMQVLCLWEYLQGRCDDIQEIVLFSNAPVHVRMNGGEIVFLFIWWHLEMHLAVSQNLPFKKSESIPDLTSRTLQLLLIGMNLSKSTRPPEINLVMIWNDLFP